MECVVIAPWHSWYPLCCLRLLLIHQERCCTCKGVLTALQIKYEAVLWGPSKILCCWTPPTVFNKNHRVTLDGDKPLTECEEESLVVEEARARRHNKSGDTCNLLYQAWKAPVARRTRRFRLGKILSSPQTMKKNTSKGLDARCKMSVSYRSWGARWRTAVHTIKQSILEQQRWQTGFIFMPTLDIELHSLPKIHTGHKSQMSKKKKPLNARLNN